MDADGLDDLVRFFLGGERIIGVTMSMARRPLRTGEGMVGDPAVY